MITGAEYAHFERQDCSLEWADMNAKCEEYGGTLARVVSQEANDGILATFSHSIRC